MSSVVIQSILHVTRAQKHSTGLIKLNYLQRAQRYLRTRRKRNERKFNKRKLNDAMGYAELNNEPEDATRRFRASR